MLAQSNIEEDKNQMTQVGISASKLCGSADAEGAEVSVVFSLSQCHLK